ncbi:hypothetical protein BKA83DRAFT_116377 [Pisolithus microcarpus]|nr:hypothetical protein BKA83DRAFT_116377 [Pisolithus microcarpus]
MSTNDPSSGHCPRQAKANLHPGQIVLDSQIKQCTPVEKQANDFKSISSLMMLLLTESTLYWLNLIWNLNAPNRRAFLLGHVNNWANKNSAASDSQTGGKSHLLSSTVPSLMTKVMSVSSATSDAAPAYRRTPMPVLNGSLDDENKNSMQDSTASLELSASIQVTTTLSTLNTYIASEVDEANNEGSDIGHDNADTHLLPPAKAPHVTTMHSDTMAKGSRHLTLAPAHSSQVSSITTNSMGSGCLCYINGHLPPTLQEDRKWTKQVLPALMTWAGSLSDPWVIPDQDMMWALQIIIITINLGFGNLTPIHPGMPIFILETCKDLLDGLAFLFQDLDPMNSENAYWSQFLLQLLAHTHLQSCVGCPDIPNLNTHSLREHGVKGAISLCCAALECVIHLFQRGKLHVNDQISTHSKATVRTPLKLNRTSRKESLTVLAFPEQNWGSCTWQYFMSVNRCDHAALKEVIMMANSVLMSTMDSTMLEDSTFQDDVMADDLAVSANQHMSICTKHTDEFNRILLSGCLLFFLPVVASTIFGIYF